VSAWQLLDDFLAGRGIRYGPPSLEQTTGGDHAPGSLHYDGLARDYGRSNSDVGAISAALVPFAKGPNAPIVELFDSVSNIFYDNGVEFTPSDELRRTHYDHVHAALRAGANLDDPLPAQFASTSSKAPRLAGLAAVALQIIAVIAGVALVGAGAWATATRGAA
jgi:hypothetical protein